MVVVEKRFDLFYGTLLYSSILYENNFACVDLTASLKKEKLSFYYVNDAEKVKLSKTTKIPDIEKPAVGKLFPSPSSFE